MKIDHFIYTRVDEDISPWEKSGFQMAFYPLELFSKKARIHIEGRIHWAEDIKPSSKISVFFQNLKGEDRLIILYYTDQPEATDKFGRRGIFLCHGLVFPRTIWQALPSPLRALDLVKDHIFKDINDALSSSLVDRATGNLAPITIDSSKLEGVSQGLAALGSELERQLVILLNRAARSQEEMPRFLLHGTPDHVSQFMDRIVAYVPDAFKPNLGWDPALDGGSLFHSPFMIAGYSASRPTGADPVHIDLESVTMEPSPGTTLDLSPRTSYEHWFIRCQDKIRQKRQIEDVYRADLFLNKKGGPGPFKPDPCFLSLNQEAIERLFSETCQRVLDPSLCSFVFQYTGLDKKLELLLQELPMKRIASILDSIIPDRESPVPGSIKTPFPDQLLKHAGPVLRCIHHLWLEGKLTPEDLSSFSHGEKLRLCRYILLYFTKEPWVSDILKAEKEIFDQLMSEARGRITDVLKTHLVTRKNLSGELAGLIVREALRQDKAEGILDDDFNYFPLLEQMIKAARFSESDINALFAQGPGVWQRLPKDAFPFLQAFLMPKIGVAEEVLNDSRIRLSLLQVLVKRHNYKERDLSGLNYTKEEIEKAILDARSKEGLLGRIKSMFAFKGRRS